MQLDALISIIVPIYNVEKYLDRCIESLVNQTYANIEIILVDDGSPDNAGKIADLWQSRDSRVRVFHKENEGVSCARNLGIREAKGDYIGFVDSDDCVDIHFVEALYAMIVRYDVRIAAIGYQKFSDSESPVLEHFEMNNTEVLNRMDALHYLFLSEKYQNYVWNKLFQRELFFDIQFPEECIIWEDLGILYLLIDQCDSIVYNAAGLYFYYQRSDSVLARPNNTKFMRDKYSMYQPRYVYLREKYPEIQNNYEDFFSTCLLLFAYQDKEEKTWALTELRKLWPKVKKKVSVRDTIKYCICVHLPHVFSAMCRLKMWFQSHQKNQKN